MNEATKNAIKKFDETCEKIAKNEPKVWLTVEEAKKIANDLLVYERLYRGAINNSSISEQDSLDEFCNSQSQKLFKRIEQAEKKK